MIPSFTLKEKLPLGQFRTHDLRLAAPKDVETFFILLNPDGKDLDLRRACTPSQDSSTLGVVSVFPGVVKFKALQEVLVIPSYLSRSHIEIQSELINRLLKIVPSNSHETVLQPGDQIVFPSGQRLVLEMSESVQVQSSLPGEQDEQTALPATFPSSPPVNPAIEETPRARHQRSKTMSATQENSIPHFDPTGAVVVESQSYLHNQSQSPVYHTAREADHSAMQHGTAGDTSQSNNFVDFEAPDSKTSASTSHLGVAGKSTIDDSVYLSTETASSGKADNAVGRTSVDGVSFQPDQPELAKHGPETDRTEFNEAVHKDREYRGTQPGPDNENNNTTQNRAASNDDSTTEEESVNHSEPDNPKGSARIEGEREDVEDDEVTGPAPRRGRSKRKIEEPGVETRATSKRTRLASRASKTIFDEPDDKDRQSRADSSNNRPSPHEKVPAPTSSTSSSQRASLADARTFRVLFSNADISSQKGIKSSMQELNLKEVNVQKPNSGNYDILVIGTENGEVKRTLKLLASLVLGKPVVTEAWLENCVSAGRIVDDYSDFTPKEAVGDVDRTAIFAGKCVYFSNTLRSFYKVWEEITYICKKAGAKQVISGTAKGTKEATMEDTIRLVSGETDKDAVALNKMGFTCYSKDLLTTSILRGYIDWESDEHEEYRINSDKPVKKAKKGSR